MSYLFRFSTNHSFLDGNIVHKNELILSGRQFGSKRFVVLTRQLNNKLMWGDWRNWLVALLVILDPVDTQR